MSSELEDLQRYQRRQRRRAVIGCIGGIVVIAALVGFVVHRGTHVRRQHFKVPYGEVMTAADYTEIHTGEEAAVVLERLDQTGRPEKTTLPYVLALFPPREEGVFCTYWEFSDKPAIFARLCFSSSNGELVQKLKNNVANPVSGEHQGQMI
jgi:hypothetical protein